RRRINARRRQISIAYEPPLRKPNNTPGPGQIPRMYHRSCLELSPQRHTTQGKLRSEDPRLGNQRSAFLLHDITPSTQSSPATKQLQLIISCEAMAAREGASPHGAAKSRSRTNRHSESPTTPPVQGRFQECITDPAWSYRRSATRPRAN